MSTDIFAQARQVIDDEERNERARRAVRVFRGMQPALTAYARSLSNRKVEVVVASGPPRTDGIKIYFRPPIELGDNPSHDRLKCDKRGDDKQQICPACRVREEVNISIYHEIGHLLGGTTDNVTKSDRLTAMRHAAELVDTDDGKQFLSRLDQYESELRHNWMEVSSKLSPFLPLLFNNLEDARVDALMFRSRPGMKAMFDSFVLKIFNGGYLKEDGTPLDWKAADANAQILIGCFLVASKYEFEGYLHPQVEEDLKDPTLRYHLGKAEDLRSPNGIFSLCIPVLVRLRELGYCKTQEELEEETQQDESGSGTDSEEDDKGGSSSDNSLGTEDHDEGDDQEGDSGGEDLGQVSGEPTLDPESDPGGDPETEADDAGGEESSTEEGESESDSSDGAGSASDGDGDEEAEGEEEAAGQSDSGLEGGVPDGPEETEESSGESNSDRSDAESSGQVPEPDSTPGSEKSSEGELDDDELSGDSDSQSGESEETGNESEVRESDESGDESGLPSSEQSSGSGYDTEGSEEGPSDDTAGIEGTGEISAEPSSGSDTGGDNGIERESDDQASDGADDTEEGSTQSNETLSELIDTGEYDERGAKRLEEELPAAADPEETAKVVGQFDYHDLDELQISNEAEDEAAVDVAIVQGLYFEKPSVNVRGVRLHRYHDHAKNEQGKDISQGWLSYGDDEYDRHTGHVSDIEVDELILGPALKDMRRVFGDNKRHGFERNLKRGKVNTRVLGKRAPIADGRVFRKKVVPVLKSHRAVIGIDISGSTVGRNIVLAKKAAWAQAELLARTGVPFAIYAHTATASDGAYDMKRDGLILDVYTIKDFDEPWGSDQKAALSTIGAVADNLDGHGIEFYRKRLEDDPATDNYLFYYTDGKMPAANYTEELAILQREVKYCKRKGNIHLLGVGIRTDSPRRHGLDTVQVDSEEDIPAVVKHLERNLLHR